MEDFNEALKYNHKKAKYKQSLGILQQKCNPGKMVLNTNVSILESKLFVSRYVFELTKDDGEL